MNNTFAAVKSACESLGYDVRSYSGRAMYGRRCLGIDVEQGTAPATVAFRLAVELMSAGEQDAAEEVAGMEFSQDSMGLGSIVYLPRMKWEESEEEEDCDCEEDESCKECAGEGF